MTRAILALVLLSTGTVRAGEVASLFPAGTLAYFEVSRPAETAAAVAELLKPSLLTDAIPFTHDRLDAVTDAQRMPGVLQAARLGLLGSPEVLAELRKVRGAAVALTGFTPRGEPKLAAAVQLGDSALLALVARAFLTTTPDLRRVATIDGVPVFQHRAFVGPLIGPDGKPFAPNDEANPLRGKTPNPGVGEPTFALVPGLFVIGSSVDEVADVLRRHMGKGTTPALAVSGGRQDAPGLFGFLAVTAAFELFDTVKTTDSAVITWMRFLLNPKAVRVATAQLRIRDNGLSLVADFDTDPSIPSPLWDLLAGGTTTPSTVAPADAAWTVTVAMPSPSRRAVTVLAFADAVAKAAGVIGRLPSDVVKESDPALFADVTAMTAFSPLKQVLPDGARAWPVLVVHAANPAAADRWVRAVPALVRHTGSSDADPVPSSETVGGVKVWTVPGTGLPWNAAIHYAANGVTFVAGLDRAVVAAAASRVGPAGPVVSTVGVIRPAGLSAQWYPTSISTKQTPPAGPEPRVLPGFFPHTVRPTGEVESLVSGIGRAARHLPPVSFTVARSGGAVRLTVDQRDLSKPLAAAIRDYILWLETRPVEVGDPQEPPIFDATPILR